MLENTQVFFYSLTYANTQRWNLAWGVGDYELNLFLSVIGIAVLISLTVLPAISMMMHLIPLNIEASMMALLAAIISFQTDWGGHIVCAFYCELFDINKHDLSNYPKLLIYQIFMTFVCILLCCILIPSNQRVKELGRKIRLVSFVDELEDGDEEEDQFAGAPSEAPTSAHTKYLRPTG